MSTTPLLRFTGAHRDLVSSAYPLGNGYRWYSPALMRFNGPDDFSPFDAGGINPYTYCGVDPINRVDPTGHEWEDAIVEGFEELTPDAAENTHAAPRGAGAADQPIATASALERKTATAKKMTKIQAATVIQRHWRRFVHQRGSVPRAEDGLFRSMSGEQMTGADDYGQDEDLGWSEGKTEIVGPGTPFNHASANGVFGGVGQSGHAGDAIWMTSVNDDRAARGYAGNSKHYFRVEATAPLKLAVLDEVGDQVFPDELAAWGSVAWRHGLDGVKTTYETSYEVVLFDRSKVRLLNIQSIF